MTTHHLAHRFRNRLAGSMLALALALPACGVDPAADVGSTAPAAESADLTVGSSGEGVGRATEYLTEHGYFPNAELGREWPAWRPVVGEAPANASVFDARTELAVRKLQAQNGLPETGIVDAETRALMGRDRCSVPDGIVTPDASDKLSLWNGRGCKRQYTWKVEGAPLGLSLPTAIGIFGTALSSWSSQASGLSFRQITDGSATDITFEFTAATNLNHPGGGNTSSFGVIVDSSCGMNARVYLSAGAVWSNTEGVSTDLQMQAQHQLGHILGFNHAPFPGSQMLPSFAMRRALALDDKYAISSLYDFYTQDPSFVATDVAAGSNGDVWAISKVAAPGGDFRPARLNRTTGVWTLTTDSSGGVRIAVEPNGTPWIVKSNGTILRRNTADPTFGAFSTMPGSATDIGIGGPPGSTHEIHVWITSRVAVNGGFQVQKFDFNSNSWVPSNGGAKKVSVTWNGIPWLVAASGQVFRHTTNLANTGSWLGVSGNLIDIAVGPTQPSIGGATPLALAWSLATNSSGQLNLSSYAEQPASSDIPLANGWLGGQPVSSLSGAASAVAVMDDGQPIIVDNQGRVFRSTR